MQLFSHPFFPQKIFFILLSSLNFPTIKPIIFFPFPGFKLSFKLLLQLLTRYQSILFFLKQKFFFLVFFWGGYLPGILQITCFLCEFSDYHSHILDNSTVVFSHFSKHFLINFWIRWSLCHLFAQVWSNKSLDLLSITNLKFLVKYFELLQQPDGVQSTPSICKLGKTKANWFSFRVSASLPGVHSSTFVQKTLYKRVTYWRADLGHK